MIGAATESVVVDVPGSSDVSAEGVAGSSSRADQATGTATATTATTSAAITATRIRRRWRSGPSAGALAAWAETKLAGRVGRGSSA